MIENIDVINRIEELKTYTSDNIMLMQAGRIPEFINSNARTTNSYQYNGIRYWRTESDQLTIHVTQLKFRKAITKTSSMFIEKMENAVKTDRIFPFLLFINGAFVKWSDMTIVKDIKYNYILVDNTDPTIAISSIDILHLPFNASYTENREIPEGNQILFRFDTKTGKRTLTGRTVISTAAKNILFKTNRFPLGIIKQEDLKIDTNCKLNNNNIIIFKDGLLDRITPYEVENMNLLTVNSGISLGCEVLYKVFYNTDTNTSINNINIPTNIPLMKDLVKKEKLVPDLDVSMIKETFNFSYDNKVKYNDNLVNAITYINKYNPSLFDYIYHRRTNVFSRTYTGKYINDKRDSKGHVTMLRHKFNKNDCFVMIFVNGELYQRYATIVYSGNRFNFQVGDYINDSDLVEIVYFKNVNNTIIETKYNNNFEIENNPIQRGMLKVYSKAITNKNLWNSDKQTLAYCTYSNGVYTSSDNDTATILQIKTYQALLDKTPIAASLVYINITNINTRYSMTFTIFDTAKYIRLANYGRVAECSIWIPITHPVGTQLTLSFRVLDNTVGRWKVDQLQLEVGSTMTEYEAFNTKNERLFDMDKYSDLIKKSFRMQAMADKQKIFEFDDNGFISEYESDSYLVFINEKLVPNEKCSFHNIDGINLFIDIDTIKRNDNIHVIFLSSSAIYEIPYNFDKKKLLLNKFYIDKEITLSSTRQFRYVHYHIPESTVRISLPYYFKTCMDIHKYMVFINGRLMSSDMYRLLIPDITNPFPEMCLYSKKLIHPGDKVEVFYIPMAYKYIDMSNDTQVRVAKATAIINKQATIDIPIEFNNISNFKENFFLIINSVFIDSNRYNVIGQSVVFKDPSDYLDANQDVFFVTMISNANFSEEHQVKIMEDEYINIKSVPVVATSNGQNSFTIPFPFKYFIENGNTFFATYKGMMIDNTKYKIIDDTLVITTWDNSVLKDESIVFTFIYTDILDVQYEQHRLIANTDNQKEFSITLPFEDYLQNNNSFFVIQNGIFLSDKEYGIDKINKKLILISPDNSGLALGEELFLIIPYNKQVNLSTTTTRVIATENNQMEFTIPIEMNDTVVKDKMFVTVGDLLVNPNTYTITNGKLKFKYPEDAVQKDRAVVFISVNKNVIKQEFLNKGNSRFVNFIHKTIDITNQDPAGKNLWNPSKQFFDTACSYSNGIYTSTDNDTETKLQLKVQQWDKVDGNYIDSDRISIQSINTRYKMTFTIDNNCKVIRLANVGKISECSIWFPNLWKSGTVLTVSFRVLNNTVGKWKIDQLQLETGSNMTDYEQFKPNSIEYSVYDIPLEDCTLKEIEFMVSIGSVFLTDDRYEVDKVNNKIIFKNMDILRLGRTISFLFLSNKYSNIIKDISYVAADVDGQTQFDINLPYTNFFELGNSFLLFKGSVFVDPKTYTIDKKNNTLTLQSGVELGRELSFIYLYSPSTNNKAYDNPSAYTFTMREYGYIFTGLNSEDIPLEYPLTKRKTYFLFINGKKVDSDNILNISSNIIRLKRDIQSRYNVCILDYTEQIAELKHGSNVVSYWDRIVNNLSTEDLNAFMDIYNIISNTEPKNTEDISGDILVNEIVRDYYSAQGFADGDPKTYTYDTLVYPDRDEKDNILIPILQAEKKTTYVK